MALVYDDRVKETTTTTGTGTYNLAGAVAGFQGFVAGIGTGNTCYYCVENGTDWEVNLGTVTDAAPDTLSRTVISSSNADAAVNWGAGTKNIFVTIPASVASGAVGQVIAVSNTQTGAVASGTTVMPADDTIPQITEGDEYMTLAHTALSTSNKLKIDVVVVCAESAAGTPLKVGVALFKDTTTDALAAVTSRMVAQDVLTAISFTHYMTAPSTSSVTYRVRIGPGAAGTVTFNGITAARIFGGVMASSITITEIKG
jgi:hypothetical protein